MIAAQRLAVDWSSSAEKIVHSLVCIFIIIITIISSISISFVVLLNFVSTHGFPLLSISPPHPTVGEGEG